MTELSQIDNDLSELGQYVALRDGYQPAVITISGKDRPGVTAAFFRVLAANKVQVLDVEQTIFRGFLSLAAFVGVLPERVGPVTTGLKDTLKVHGQSVTVELQEQVQSSRPRSSHVVVILGNPVDAIDLSRVGQTLADYDANIDSIRGISDYPVTGLELKITAPDTSPGGAQKIRKALAALTTELNVDIAIERSGLLRRSKRLVCFDCDSTLITGEVIEMLAAHAGKEAEVAAVTERAMRGELDFEESLRERVKALEPEGPDLDAKTIPHEIPHWIGRDEHLGAVHLTKGCYRGQETVARVDNLGRSPRVMVLLHLDGSAPVAPAVGAEITSGTRTVGRLGTVIHDCDLGPIALALVKRSALDSDLTVGDVAVTVDPDSLPVDDGEQRGRAAVNKLRGRD